MPRHITIIFPGQGSQSIGMLDNFSSGYLDSYRDIILDSLGFDLIDIISNGSEEQLNKKISYDEVLKNIKNRDKSDTRRKFGKLKKTKDSTLLNTSNISISACFKKIKQIMDRKIIA